MPPIVLYSVHILCENERKDYIENLEIDFHIHSDNLWLNMASISNHKNKFQANFFLDLWDSDC